MKAMQFFKEANGHFSAIRFALLFAVFACLFTWSYLSFTSGMVQTFPLELAAFVGILGGAKAAQKFAETE